MIHIRQWLPQLSHLSLEHIQNHSRGDQILAEYFHPLVTVS